MENRIERRKSLEQEIYGCKKVFEENCKNSVQIGFKLLFLG